MKEELTANVGPAIKEICKSVAAQRTTDKKGYGLHLYNQLITADYSITENDLWYITDCLGRNEQVFTAIICSKIVSSKSMFYMLSIAHFNVNLCHLAFHYYDDSEELFARVIKALEERGLFHRKELLVILNSSPSHGKSITPITNPQKFVHYHA